VVAGVVSANESADRLSGRPFTYAPSIPRANAALELGNMMRRVEMHRWSMAAQIQLVQGARLLVGVNGAQISAMLFLRPGAACLNLYAAGARWTDAGFGALQRVALIHLNIRYYQVEVSEFASEPAHYASPDPFRKWRDADLDVPYATFRHLVAAALPPGLQKGPKPTTNRHREPTTVEPPGAAKSAGGTNWYSLCGKSGDTDPLGSEGDASVSNARGETSESFGRGRQTCSGSCSEGPMPLEEVPIAVVMAEAARLADYFDR